MFFAWGKCNNLVFFAKMATTSVSVTSRTFNVCERWMVDSMEAFPERQEQIGSKGVFHAGHGVIVKLIPHSQPEKVSSELSAHIVNLSLKKVRFAPLMLGWRFWVEWEGEWHFAIWMEAYDCTLIEWANAHSKKGRPGRLGKQATRRLVEALSVLHAAGISHNDFHHRNIVVRIRWDDMTPQVRIIDFESAQFGFDWGNRALQALDRESLRGQHIARFLCLLRDRAHPRAVERNKKK